MSYYGPRSAAVPARAGRRIHRLRSLVLLGDGTDVAEPLLPARAATATGTRPTCRWACRRRPTIWQRMADRCWTGKNYYSGALPWYSVGVPGQQLLGRRRDGPGARIDHFFATPRAGELPNFALIDPDFEAERRPPAPRPGAVRGVRRQHLPSAGREPAVEPQRCSWSCSTSTAASTITSRRRAWSIPIPTSGSWASACRRSSSGRRCGAARWCRRRSSTCRSPPPWRRASASRASARAWTPATTCRPASIRRLRRRARAGGGAVAAHRRAQRVARSLRAPLRASSVPELARAARAGRIPRRAHRRALRRRARTQLAAHAQELEAIRVIG